MLRHLITRDDRPVKASRRDGTDAEASDEDDDGLPDLDIDEDEDELDRPERIGEDESEAAPAAID